MKVISSLLCTAAILSLTNICQAQSWSIEYGKETNKVSYYNSKSDPNFAEDSPYGPMSFRVIGDNLWVLDSIAGRIIGFDNKGNSRKVINVPELEGFKLLEDFAFAADGLGKFNAVWVANAADSVIRKISISDGKVLTKVGGNGNEPGKVLQVHQLEVDVAGRLYVADIARNTISIFTSTGTFLREYPWQSSGFVVDKHANLHLLHYSENAGYFHRVYSNNGQLIGNTHLGLVNNTNTKILSVDNEDNIILSMIPESGFKGTLLLCKINKQGQITEKAEYIPASTMNRDVYVDGKIIYQAEANFETAPKTKFLIKTIKWEEIKDYQQDVDGE